MKPRAPAAAAGAQRGPLACGSCGASPRAVSCVAFGRSRRLSVAASAARGSDKRRKGTAAAKDSSYQVMKQSMHGRFVAWENLKTIIHVSFMSFTNAFANPIHM